MKTSLLLLWITGCAGPKAPTVTLSIAGHEVEVEIAATEGERARGLMHRDHLPEDRGMLFVYEDDRPRRFWMKDTRIPLSIAFVDHAGTIVRIADMQPYTTEGTPSLYPARYALEVNQGWFTSRSIAPGAQVEGLERVAAP